MGWRLLRACLSEFADPPHDAGEAERAACWALASAREAPAETPVCTALLLPWDNEAPHARWLGYPEVVELARFRPGVLPMEPADAWQGERRPHYPDKCRGHVLVAVGNAAGLARLRLMAEEWEALPSLYPHLPYDTPWPWQRAGGSYRYDAAAQQRSTQQAREGARQIAAALREQYTIPRRFA